MKSRCRFCNLHKLLHAKMTACICVDIAADHFSKFQSPAGLHLPELRRLTLQRDPCMSLPHPLAPRCFFTPWRLLAAPRPMCVYFKEGAKLCLICSKRMCGVWAVFGLESWRPPRTLTRLNRGCEPGLRTWNMETFDKTLAHLISSREAIISFTCVL